MVLFEIKNIILSIFFYMVTSRHFFQRFLLFHNLCTSHLKPPHPPIRAWAGHSLLIQVKVSEVLGSPGQKWVVQFPTSTFQHIALPL